MLSFQKMAFMFASDSVTLSDVCVTLTLQAVHHLGQSRGMAVVYPARGGDYQPFRDPPPYLPRIQGIGTLYFRFVNTGGSEASYHTLVV